MGIFEFLLGLICVLIGGFLLLLVVAVIYAEKEAIKENEILKQELIKARKKILKREYKENKEVK